MCLQIKYIHAVHDYNNMFVGSGAAALGSGMDTEIELDGEAQHKPHLYRFKWNVDHSKVGSWSCCHSHAMLGCDAVQAAQHQLLLGTGGEGTGWLHPQEISRSAGEGVLQRIGGDALVVAASSGGWLIDNLVAGHCCFQTGSATT